MDKTEERSPTSNVETQAVRPRRAASILGRLSQAVREQNWFAVALELGIVVVGVFLGIQLGNWNEERMLRAQEATYLVQLRDEIQGNAEAIAYQRRFVERIVEAGRRTLAFLEGGEECAANCEQLLIDAFHASQVWGTGYLQSKYDEVVRLGLPSDEATRRTVESFSLFINGWDVVNTAPPAYRERVRGYFTPEASEVLWRGCYVLDGGRLETLAFDCAEDLRLLDIDPILRAIRADADLVPQLRYWIGQNVIAVVVYPNMLAHADSAITAIDEQLSR